MKLYRIYTENKNKSWIKRQTNKLFPAFTLIDAEGCWKDAEEKSLIIEIIAANSKEDKNKLAVLRDLIKRHNQQESVLLTEQEVQVEF